MKRVLVCCILALLVLSGCMGGGSEIVLPDRTPVTPPAVTPDPAPETGDRYLVAGETLLGLLTAEGRWQGADRLPEGITGWTIFGDTVTERESLPADLPAGVLAVSGAGVEGLELQSGSAWEPATDLLYALLRDVTGTEPLADPPGVTLPGSIQLPGEAETLRFLEVRGSYALLVLEQEGVYSLLPGAAELLGAYLLEGQPLLLCADAQGAPLLLGRDSGGWRILLPEG